MTAWSGGVFDTSRNRLILWGGGHSDYFGNEVYALDLDTQAITRLTDPAVPVATGCPEALLNNTQPNSRHTYDGIEYMPNVDKMFVYGGSLATCGNASTSTWAFNFANNQWEAKSPTGTGPANNFGIATAYDANSGRVFLHDNNNLFAYNPTTNAYQRLTTNGNTIDYHMAAVIDPVRKKFVIVGGGQAYIYDISGTTFTRQTLTSTGGSAIINSDYPGLAYDPTRDRIVAWNGGNNVYELNLANNTWTSSSFAGGPTTGPWGTFGHFQYSPTSNVFVTLNSVDQNASILRLSPGSGGAAFDFSMSNSGNASTQAGGSDTTTVTAALVSGTAQSIAFTASGLPSGATASFNPASCAICSTTMTINTASSTPAGTSTITVTGTSGSVVRTTSFSLQVTSPSTPPPNPPSGSQVTSFTLTSAVSGTVPFTVGLGFRKGEITTPVLDEATSQVVVKSRWPDNSVKHAIASGRVTMSSGTPNSIGVFQGSAPGGTNLTASDIQAANPSASIQLGSIGTVNLSSLLGSPFRTWISGPEMVEAHYRSNVGSDASLSAWFYVRLYRGGRIWIRAVVENGFLDVSSPTKSYVPTVSIGGSTVYNNGGASLSHYGHTRWTAEGWIGTDPQVTARLDTEYLMATKLVPNYLGQTPTTGALNGLYQNYSPMQNGDWTVSMGETGFQEQIGILPNWDALYVTSGGDARAFRSVLANAKALNSYPIVWNDSATKMPPTPSARPTWTVSGANGGGATIYSAGPLTWDVAHHGSGGYLAYLITGDYYYLETMEDQASLCYLINSASQGSGTSRILGGQTRAVAWCQRTVGQLAGIGPADSIVNDYRTLLSNNGNYWNGQVSRSGQNLLGYLYSYELGNNSYGAGNVAPWQQHFFVQTYGFVSDLEPLSNMSAWNSARDWMYRSVVGILGTGGSGNFCFTAAGQYNIAVTTNNNADATTWFDTWGQVYQGTVGSANPSSCGNSLTGGSGGAPNAASTGYWGNLLPAIAYAVDHGAAGASASWARLSGASNWSTVLGSGFNSTPIWGIVPRDGSAPPPPPPPADDPPTISFSAPAANATVSGASVTVTAAASDDNGIASVQFRVDGNNIGSEDTAAPYSVTWNTTTIGNGSHTLTAVAVDTAGQSTTATRTVTVSNTAPDTQAPAISNVTATGVTSTGATISWTTNEASDTQVQYGLTTSYGSTTTLNNTDVTSHSQAITGLTASRTYNYRVLSRDAAGNLATSGNFQFTTSAGSSGGVTEIFPGTNVFSDAAERLVAGGTLIVHQGTYTETDRMSLQMRGTASAPIVIRGAAGEARPVITRSGAVQNTINIEGSAAYITIRGLEITGNGGDGINMSGGLSFITIEDNDIHDVDVGINLKQTMDNITIRRNHIRNTGRNNGTGEGMYVGCNDSTCIVSNSLIENNWIHDTLSGTTQGDGIEVKVGSHSNIIRDNVVYNRPYPGIFVYGTGSNPVNIVEGNVVWNALEGIYAVSDAIVRNNIVFGSGTGLSLYGHAQVPQMKNITAVNNTLYNNTNGVYMRWNSGSNLILANNAVYSPGKTAFNTSGSSVGTFASNYFEGGSDRASDGTRFISGGSSTAAFVSPTTMNFWPRSGGALLNNGTAVYSPSNDFNRASRAAPFDVGAYEANGAASNPGWAIETDFKELGSIPPPPPPPADTTAPTISGINASNVTQTGATINWTTNEASDTQVEYGLTTSYGSQTTLNNTDVTSHTQTLTGLTAGRTYNYRVKSRDAAGNLATSGNQTFVTTSTTTPPPTPAGLIGFWKMDEGAGSTVADASGKAHPGTLSNNPSWVTGKFGGALRFNATDNGNDNDDPRLVIGRGFDFVSLPLTISAWVNPIDYNDDRKIISKRDSPTASDMRLDWGMRKNTGATFLGRGSSGSVNFTYAPPLNTWTYLTVVLTSSDSRLYVNGTLRETRSAFTLGTDASANTVIGGTGEGTGGDNDPFKGSIDEVRVYSRALTAAEVQSDMNNGTASQVGGDGPFVSLAPDTAGPGDTVTVEWGGITAPTPTDWMGLYSQDASDGQYSDWKYVSCSQTVGGSEPLGTCQFTLSAGIAPGTYHVRLFSNGTYTLINTSNGIVVTDGSTPPPPPEEPPVEEPPTPPSSALTVSPASTAAGTAVTAAWNGIASPRTTDWIALYSAGAADNAFIDWMYVSCSKAAGSARASGSCSFGLPGNLPAGLYELRLFANGGWDRLLTSNGFTVTVSVPSGPSMTAAPTTVNRGGSVTATWSGAANTTPLDWIGLYPVGSGAMSWQNWMYVSCTQSPTTGRASGTCSMSIPGGIAPGMYELRLQANGQFDIIATSNAFRVN